MKNWITHCGAGVCFLLFAGTTYAHSGTGVAGGLVSGFFHPFLGLDHLVAMVAVGLWGAQLEKPAIWLLPMTFPLVMALGGLLGIAGVAMPYFEIGIAFSALVLGLLIALKIKPPLGIAALVVGFFAVFHGYAHGTEVPAAANPLAYGVGFVVATGLLHLAGIVLGILTYWPTGANAVRAVGGVIAALGVYFSALSVGMIQ